jgi:DNA primase
MRELVQTHGENSAEDRSALLAAAIPLLTQLPLAALRMQLSRELADRVHISVNEVNQLVQQHAAQRAKRQSLQQQSLGQRQVESGKRTGFQSKSSLYRSNAGVAGACSATPSDKPHRKGPCLAASFPKTEFAGAFVFASLLAGDPGRSDET